MIPELCQVFFYFDPNGNCMVEVPATGSHDRSLEDSIYIKLLLGFLVSPTWTNQHTWMKWLMTMVKFNESPKCHEACFFPNTVPQK